MPVATSSRRGAPIFQGSFPCTQCAAQSGLVIRPVEYREVPNINGRAIAAYWYLVHSVTECSGAHCRCGPTPQTLPRAPSRTSLYSWLCSEENTLAQHGSPFSVCLPSLYTRGSIISASQCRRNDSKYRSVAADEKQNPQSALQDRSPVPSRKMVLACQPLLVLRDLSAMRLRGLVQDRLQWWAGR